MTIVTRGTFPGLNAFDGSDAFLEELPEIARDRPFRFACHPRISCFNECCRGLTLVLTPYDVLGLRRALAMGSEDFIRTRAKVGTAPDTGFPAVRLGMTERLGRPCPFVSEAGCTVYENRPGACRAYPLARATRLDNGGKVVERICLVREDHCKGFAEETVWTPESFLADQGLKDYNRSNDRLMELMARQKNLGAAIEPKFANMALLSLYQPDRFQAFIRQMGLFERVEVEPERQTGILADEEETLRFGMDWLELVLFGDCGNLQRIKP